MLLLATLLRDEVSELFQGSNVQGVWNEGDDLYAIEDRHAQGTCVLAEGGRDRVLEVTAPAE